MPMRVVPRFKAIEGWEKLPAGCVHRDVDGVAVDSRGELSVGEVTWTFGISKFGVREGAHTFQKFARC
jgi:hypothetical protein